MIFKIDFVLFEEHDEHIETGLWEDENQDYLAKQNQGKSFNSKHFFWQPDECCNEGHLCRTRYQVWSRIDRQQLTNIEIWENECFSSWAKISGVITITKVYGTEYDTYSFTSFAFPITGKSGMI